MEYGCVRVGGGGIAEIPELVAAEEGRFHFWMSSFRETRSIDESRERETAELIHARLFPSPRVSKTLAFSNSRARRVKCVYI